jgi:hypothetical protein
MTVIIRGKISEVLLRFITNINCSQSITVYQIKLKVNAERRCRNFFFFVNFITLLVLLLYLNANSRMQ